MENATAEHDERLRWRVRRARAAVMPLCVFLVAVPEAVNLLPDGGGPADYAAESFQAAALEPLKPAAAGSGHGGWGARMLQAMRGHEGSGARGQYGALGAGQDIEDGSDCEEPWEAQGSGGSGSGDGFGARGLPGSAAGGAAVSAAGGRGSDTGAEAADDAAARRRASAGAAAAVQRARLLTRLTRC